MTAGDPPFLLMQGKNDPIVRMQNTETLAKKLKTSGDWVTTKYYDNIGHMEPAFAMFSMSWPILAMCSASGGPLGATACVYKVRNCTWILLQLGK